MCEEGARLLRFRASQVIIIVTNLGTGPVPTHIFVVSHPLTINQYFHTFIIKTIWLAKVEHVEADLSTGLVRSSKEKPLCVT